MSKKTRAELKAEIKALKKDVSDLQWEVDSLQDEPIPEPDFTEINTDIFEAEGRKMEGREFGQWFLSRVKRYVAYG